MTTRDRKPTPKPSPAGTGRPAARKPPPALVSTTDPALDVVEQVDGAQLLDETLTAIRRYVILPGEHAAAAIVLWVAASHGMPAWNAAPRLVIKAPEKRCGKSRLLDLVEALSWHPLMTTNASPSAVYRAIGEAPDDPPTLLIDEADTIFGPKAGEHEDLRGLLNAGHQRGRPALRYNAGQRKVERIETFAMAGLAGIGSMPDTIEDRAVIVGMRRRAPDEHVQPYRTRRDGPALHELRDRLHQWVRDHLDDLTGAAPDMPVEDRAADTWEPLVALADLAGRHWPDLARASVLAMTGADEDIDEVSLSIRLLIDCRTAFGPATALTSTTLIQRLRADPEAPWTEVAGDGLTVRRLAYLLRGYGIRSTTRRWEDGLQAKGYTVDAFKDAWARYCPLPEAATATTRTGPEPGSAGDPYQASQGHHRRSERYGSRPWDGSIRTNETSVPPLTCDATLGTDGTDPHPTPSRTVCITCREPLTHDDGTHTHPTCATA